MSSRCVASSCSVRSTLAEWQVLRLRRGPGVRRVADMIGSGCAVELKGIGAVLESKLVGADRDGGAVHVRLRRRQVPRPQMRLAGPGPLVRAPDLPFSRGAACLRGDEVDLARPQPSPSAADRLGDGFLRGPAGGECWQGAAAPVELAGREHIGQEAVADRAGDLTSQDREVNDVASNAGNPGRAHTRVEGCARPRWAGGCSRRRHVRRPAAGRGRASCALGRGPRSQWAGSRARLLLRRAAGRHSRCLRPRRAWR